MVLIIKKEGIKGEALRIFERILLEWKLRTIYFMRRKAPNSKKRKKLSPKKVLFFSQTLGKWPFANWKLFENIELKPVDFCSDQITSKFILLKTKFQYVWKVVKGRKELDYLADTDEKM